jgi:type VI secretion system protein ImpL
VASVLGATLPVRAAQAGVYAEEESKRLTKAFDELFYSIAERRLDLLGRESQCDKLPGIYEFPREMRKMRNLLVDYLVNLVRPSQLQSNPFLRGFYFSGVRAVMVDDIAHLAREVAVAETVGDVGATRIFSAGHVRQPQATDPAYVAESRKIPQWVFLTHLFNDVIFKDRVALSASSFSSRVNLLRRLTLIAAIAFSLVFAIGFLVSFFENRALETELEEASRQLPTERLGPGQLVSVGDLQRLERLRRSVATLSRYSREGHPSRMGWFLYIGDRLYPPARQLYFDRFHRMMFGGTQDQILTWLRGVPNSPELNQSYDEKTYNTLEACLITTSYPQKSTQAFLSPVLLSFWRGTRDIEATQGELAKQQFDFYATELAIRNLYPSTALADDTVAHARGYLKNFKGIDRYYLPLLSEADGKTASVTFNSLFRNSKDVVVNDVPVRRAFTKDGFAFMQTALTQPQRYFNAEEWVLGKEGAEPLDVLQLRQLLPQRYANDFLKAWYNVLKSTRFLAYGSVSDADNKLRKVADPSSPLLELLWFVSHSTDVDSQDIRAAFQPVQSVVPPGATDRYIQPTNQPYMSALTALSTNVNFLAANGGLANREAVTKVSDAIIVAKNEVGGIAQKFIVSQELPIYKVSRVLLEAPITSLEAVIRGASSAGLNKGGQDFCHDFFSPMTQYYPFDATPNATDLPLKQFNDMFAPGTGAFWKYADTLKDYLAKQGSHYVAIDSGTAHINPQFVAFFDRAADLSNALYQEGASPKLTFSLGQLQTDVDGLTIKMGSQSLAANESFKTFTWTGSENESVQVSAKGAPYGSNTGPWAVFHFVSGARWHDAGPNLVNLERTMETNGQTMRLPPPDNQVMYYRYQLSVSGKNPFRPSEWSNMKCISQVTR